MIGELYRQRVLVWAFAQRDFSTRYRSSILGWSWSLLQPLATLLVYAAVFSLAIVDILEEYIKPAVAQDGGNIAFMGYKDKIVEVQLQGACSGCPSSTMTLKNGILSILQKMLPTLVDDVVAVNG